MSNTFKQSQSGELTDEIWTALDSEIPLDMIFGILSNHVRRRMLLSLSTEEVGDISIDELTDRLTMDDEVTMSRETLAVELYHHHIPQLADSGILNVDNETKIVRYRPNARLESLMNVVRTLDDW